MRAVVDTNIVIRALIKPDGTVGPVLQRLAANDYTLVYSKPILDELLAKLALPRIRHKYHLDDQAIETLLALFALRGILVQPTRHIQVCRDPKDNIIIEAALEGAAAFIVTGDEDLLTLKRFERIRIVTPRILLAAF
jgi:putative PIN family toxin of toxin-antitoxin system